MKKILVVDDHPLILKGVRETILQFQSSYLIFEAMDGKTTIEIAQKEKPDIIIMDIELKNECGFDVSQTILSFLEDIKIIVLSCHCEYRYIRKTLDLGLNGYVTKTTVYTEIYHAIQVVMSGKTYLCEDAIKGLKNIGLKNDVVDCLTIHEREILKLLVEGHPQKTIAAYFGINEKTVSTHKINIMKKLGLLTFSDLVLYAVKNGIL